MRIRPTAEVVELLRDDPRNRVHRASYAGCVAWCLELWNGSQCQYQATNCRISEVARAGLLEVVRETDTDTVYRVI